jgi:hypothetical protein
LICASSLATHLVQHLVPLEAVVILAPAQPVQGIPQLGHEIAIVMLVFNLLTI